MPIWCVSATLYIQGLKYLGYHKDVKYIAVLYSLELKMLPIALFLSIFTISSGLEKKIEIYKSKLVFLSKVHF